MKAHIVRFGNSQGIHLPKVLLTKAKLGNEVELRAELGRIMISKTVKPRIRWAKAARRMRARGEDRLFYEPTNTQFDKKRWKW